MGTELNGLIDRALSAKQGNKEFALFYDGESEWAAHIGNSSRYVGLGEISGDVIGEGATPVAAVSSLLAKLNA